MENSELKLILLKLKIVSEAEENGLYLCDKEHSKILLDYIINLQQENERLNTNLGELQNAIDNIAELVGIPEGMSVEDVYDKVKDYKSRCEKAVEYIKEHIKYECDVAFNGMQFYSYHLYDFSKDNLLNILNGRSDE